MIRILVTGSRHVDATAVRIVTGALAQAVIDAAQVDRDIVIVQGGARGVDAVAEHWARPLKVETHPAEWDRFGKRAGHLRNEHMVSLGAHVCLAFPRTVSPGTWDCIHRAAGAGIPVRIYPLPDLAS